MDRKQAILDAGAKLASKHGAVNVTRRMVAGAAKVPESVVSYYMGSSADAQRAYKRRMKAMKLVEPDKAKIAAIGVKLRAHSKADPRDTRKRSVKEVEAIKRKGGAAKKATGRHAAGRRASASSAAASTRKSHTSASREVKPAAPASKPAKRLPARTPPGPANTPARTPPAVKSAARPPKEPPTDPVELPPPLSPAFP